MSDNNVKQKPTPETTITDAGAEQAQPKEKNAPQKPITDSIPDKPEDITRKPGDEEIAQEIEDNIKLSEVENGYRIVKGTPWGDVRIYKDTIMWVAQAGDEAFSKKRFELLSDKTYPTLEENMEVLAERGIWTEDNEKHIDDLAQEIIALYQKQAAAKKETERNGIKMQIDKKMSDYLEALQEKDAILGYSVEMRADIERRTAMIVKAVRKHIEDENDYKKLPQVWPTTEALLNEDIKDFSYIMQEAQKFWSGVELGGESFFDESPGGETSS